MAPRPKKCRLHPDGGSLMQATGCGRGQKWPKGLCDAGNGHWRPTAQFRGWRVGTSHQGRMFWFSFWFSCVRRQRLGEAWIPTGSKLFWEIGRLVLGKAELQSWLCCGKWSLTPPLRASLPHLQNEGWG